MSATNVIENRRAWEVICGDSLATLEGLPGGVVSCCVTSPPYWMLRDYGCPGQLGLEPLHDCGGAFTGSPCGACYVCHLVAVFREVRRVLHPSGTLWLNCGDSYASGEIGRKDRGRLDADKGKGWATYDYGQQGRQQGHGTTGLAPKNLLMIPARVALALQADGWVLRNEVCWLKKSPMPSSCRDRMTSATERIYLLAARGRYFYDQEAERVISDANPIGEVRMAGRQHKQEAIRRSTSSYGTLGTNYSNPDGRNLWDYWLDTDPDDEEPDDAPGALGDAWLLGSEPQKHSHYAAFPSIIPRRAIRLGSSQHGVCPECRAPWVRVTERRRAKVRPSARRLARQETEGDIARTAYGGTQTESAQVRTLGWQPTCKHGHEPIPALVLDPFCGSGVAGKVAREEGRRFLGIDLSPKYCRLARERIGSVAPLFD